MSSHARPHLSVLRFDFCFFQHFVAILTFSTSFLSFRFPVFAATLILMHIVRAYIQGNTGFKSKHTPKGKKIGYVFIQFILSWKQARVLFILCSIFGCSVLAHPMTSVTVDVCWRPDAGAVSMWFVLWGYIVAKHWQEISDFQIEIELSAFQFITLFKVNIAEENPQCFRWSFSLCSMRPSFHQ